MQYILTQDEYNKLKSDLSEMERLVGFLAWHNYADEGDKGLNLQVDMAEVNRFRNGHYITIMPALFDNTERGYNIGVKVRP